MGRSIRGSNTEKNVALAFANESMTVNRYSIFSRQAFKEGLNQAGEVFAAVSEEEKKHAETLFGFFEGGMVELNLKLPAVPAGPARDNINASISVENAAWSLRYPEFAGVARQEGFPAIAEAFESFARDEKAHEERFKTLLKSL
ncbi:MAG: rubrerythrin family protein [Syntrophaceae bacterium]